MKQARIGMRVLVLWAITGASPILVAQTTAQSARPSPNPWVELLKSSDPKVRAKAAREMGRGGDVSVIPALTAQLSDASSQVRREVVIALAQFHVSAAMDSLITATRDPDPSVRVLAVQGLVGNYSGDVPSSGFAAFFRRGYRRAKGRFVAENAQIDPGLKVDPKVVAALAEVMKDERSLEPAREAAKGLGILLARPAVPDLVKSAHSTDEELARTALDSLSKIKDISAGPQLLDLLDSPLTGVKRDAAATVGLLRGQAAAPKLRSIFENDPDEKDRQKAFEGLAYLGDPAAVPLFTKMLSSGDKALRTSAAEGLARAKDANTLAEVEKALGTERNAGVRLALEFAVTALGKYDYLAALVDQLSSTLRSDVAKAYLIELSRDPQFLPKLYPFLSSGDADVREKLCIVLMYTGDQSTLEHVDRLSHDKSGSVSAAALRAARAIRERVSAPASPATPTATQRP
jgi:HEAT repeat protein